MAFPASVAVPAFECIESLASRVALANGYPSLRLFYVTSGLSRRKLAEGDTSEVSKLAMLVGGDDGMLARNTVFRVQLNHGIWQLGHACFDRQSTRGKRLRFCINCVANNVAAGAGLPAARTFVRASWISRSVRNCTEHERPLFEMAVKHTRDDDFARFIQDNMALISEHAAVPHKPVPIDVDRYVEDRIKGVLREPFLDRFEAYVAIELCYYLGQLIKRHHHTLRQLPASLRNAHAREVGFAVARNGEAAIRDIVAAIIHRDRADSTFQAVFGALCRWLREKCHKPAYSELVELFQDIAERNLPVGPEDVCVVKVRRRYLHTVHSASIEYDLHDNRVLELMRSNGLLGNVDYPRLSIWFDADRAHEILTDAAETLTSKEVQNILRVGERGLNGILESGLLPRVEERAETRNYSRIRKKDLLAFQEAVFAAAKYRRPSPSMMSIQAACQRVGAKLHEVLRVIMSGEIENVALVDGHRCRIDELRLDVEEVADTFEKVRAVGADPNEADLLTLKRTQQLLGVNPPTVPHLVRLGALDTVGVEHPRTKARKFYIHRASVETFIRDHLHQGTVSDARDAPDRHVRFFGGQRHPTEFRQGRNGNPVLLSCRY